VNQVEGRTANRELQSEFQGLRIYICFFSVFSHWYFDNHLYLLIFKAVFVKIIILVVAILKIT
jgi:hypothetical protein